MAAAQLTFSPLAWLKLQLFLHAGDTEVGGFAISAEDDLLYIADFVTVRQHVTAVTVAFEDAAVADYFDGCVDQGLPPARFGRIWLHTHPGDSPEPSLTDEETFSRVFGGCDWAVMFICSRTCRTYARLQFFAGPGGQVRLPVSIDWASWPTLVIEQVEQMSSLLCQWIAEYAANVVRDPRVRGFPHLRLVSEEQDVLGARIDVGDERDAMYEGFWTEQEAAWPFEAQAEAVPGVPA